MQHRGGSASGQRPTTSKIHEVQGKTELFSPACFPEPCGLSLGLYHGSGCTFESRRSRLFSQENMHFILVSYIITSSGSFSSSHEPFLLKCLAQRYLMKQEKVSHSLSPQVFFYLPFSHIFFSVILK